MFGARFVAVNGSALLWGAESTNSAAEPFGLAHLESDNALVGVHRCTLTHHRPTFFLRPPLHNDRGCGSQLLRGPSKASSFANPRLPTHRDQTESPFYTTVSAHLLTYIFLIFCKPFS